MPHSSTSSFVMSAWPKPHGACVLDSFARCMRSQNSGSGNEEKSDL